MNKIKQFFTVTIKSRAAKNGAYAGAFSALMVAAIVAVNLIMSTLPTRYTELDFTDARIFSLSEQTAQHVQTLAVPVDIYYIAVAGQEDLAVTSLLDKYSDLSDNINVRQIDPIVNPTFAAGYGTDVAIGSIIVESSAEKTRVIDVNELYTLTYDELTYTETASFAGEEKITSAILYVSSDDLPKIYTTEGHSEIELQQGYIQSLANANIESIPLNLLTQGQVPEDADLLFINAPLSDFSDDETEILQHYLDGGGNVILITNYGEYNTDSSPMPNLEKIAKSYGLSSQDGVIFEGDTDYHISDYPHFLLPEVIPHEVTQPLLSNFVITPLVHGIETDDNLPEDIVVYPLLTTTADAYLNMDAYEDSTTEPEEGDLAGPFDVAVISENIANGSKFVWLPTSGFADDATDELVSGTNRNLFVNIISYCTGFEKGITLDAKQLNSEYLTVPQSFGNLWSIVFAVCIPVGVIIAGFVIWARRRRR